MMKNHGTGVSALRLGEITASAVAAGGAAPMQRIEARVERNALGTHGGDQAIAGKTETRPIEAKAKLVIARLGFREGSSKGMETRDRRQARNEKTDAVRACGVARVNFLQLR